MLGHLHDRPTPPDVDASPPRSSCAAWREAALRRRPRGLDALLAACEDGKPTPHHRPGRIPGEPPSRQADAKFATSLAGLASARLFCAAFGGGLAVRAYDRTGAPLASATSALAPPVAGTPAPELPRGDGEPPRRALVVGEGGYSLRVLLPERILVGVDYEIILEAWDPEGEPLATSEMILTLDDPQGASRGIAAKPTDQRGRYRFTRGFATPGSHQLRVFRLVAVRLFFDVVDSRGVAKIGYSPASMDPTFLALLMPRLRPRRHELQRPPGGLHRLRPRVRPRSRLRTRGHRRAHRDPALGRARLMESELVARLHGACAGTVRLVAGKGRQRGPPEAAGELFIHKNSLAYDDVAAPGRPVARPRHLPGHAANAPAPGHRPDIRAPCSTPRSAR
jgi:hypothetical protein